MSSKYSIAKKNSLLIFVNYNQKMYHLPVKKCTTLNQNNLLTFILFNKSLFEPVAFPVNV